MSSLTIELSDSVRGLHDSAMMFAEDAIRMNNPELRRQMFAKAYNFERSAAVVAENPLTRAVLWRSAATLALDVGEPRWSLACINECLMRDVNPEIKAELADVLDRIAAVLRK